MGIVLTLILAVQLLCGLAMVGLILMQQGKGADMGAAFGSGNSGSLFGASGGANFLSRSTAVVATVFFVCTLALAYFGNARPQVSSGSVLEGAAPSAAPAPAAAASAPAAQQIPGTSPAPVTLPVAGSKPAPVAPVAPAGPAGQIPTK